MDNNKILNDLALKACRKRARRQTGFIHYNYESAYAAEQDTIPLFENFTFALALFSTRLSDSILEGRLLLEKLLNFEVDGNFPVYLHEYPRCRSKSLAHRIARVLMRILTEFPTVLGSELKLQIENLVNKILQPSHLNPKTPEEWGEALIENPNLIEDAVALWHPSLHAYIGPHQRQEKGEPAVTLLDLYMGQLYGSFSSRALQDHPIQMCASLLRPPSGRVFTPSNSLAFSGNSLLWGGPAYLHSLYCDPRKCELQQDPKGYLFTLPDQIPEEADTMVELAFFCNLHESTTLLVNGKRATTFQLGDLVTIDSKEVILNLIFSLAEGEGSFFGQISRGNRPTQCTNRGDHLYEAYDWQITLRTIHRTLKTSIKTQLATLFRGQS